MASRQETTSLRKLFNNLDTCPASSTPIALITTGSFNPVHREHLTLHARVKAFLETSADMRVVGSFLSPSHNSYVSGKMRGLGREATLLTFDQRCQLIAACVDSDPLVEVDRVCFYCY